MLKTDHPIEPEELMAYLDGELPPDRAGVAAGHLERCRECQSLAADLQSVSRRMLEWQVEPVSPIIPESVAGALEYPRRKPRASRWTWGFAAASVFVLMVLWTRSTINSSQNAAQAYQRLSQFSSVPKQQPRPGDSVQMIARTAELVLTTQEFDRARAALEEILKRHNGYLGQLTVNAPSGAGRTLDATLRIPTDQRDAAIAEIKKLGRVESESQTGEEVTSQYIDLEARLLNARNTEQRLTDILRQRAGKLADVLAVEQEISRVRGEIEQMEAQKKTLTNRVEFLTLEVHLAENYRPPANSMPGRFRDAALAGYQRLVNGVAAAILLLLKFGPSMILWAAILFFPARYAWKKLRRS